MIWEKVVIILDYYLAQNILLRSGCGPEDAIQVLWSIVDVLKCRCRTSCGSF